MPKLLSKYDLFVFDWDGTLCSLRYMQRIADFLKSRVVQKVLGARPMAKIDKSSLVVQTKAYNMAHATEGERIRNALLSTGVDIGFMVSRPRLKNGALETLKMLKKAGKEVALLSNGSSWRILKEMKREGIQNYFDVIISTKDIKAPKPDPLGLIGIVSLMEADTRRVLYVGDMREDILTAKYAGIDSCGISDGFASHSDLKKQSPKYLFSSMEGFAKAL
jgi:phosphoglycolate phosphatase-like HAD superfamily hydrolase